MNVEFINPFLSSLLNVLSTMAQTELKPGKPSLKKDELARGDVSGLIGMVGPQTKGSLSITFDENLALTIMERMLGERPDSVNEEVTDMVGEITNMVTGGAKNLLGEKGYEFDMATPVVVSGKGHTIAHKCEGAKVLIPFTSADGNANIEVSFDKL
ncbi:MULTISPECIES: chemotaxis protein CheX [Pseudoalteromonas]|uniref:chemotaxis protein CheX n=1 Tax=Pseudoalteromonas TaxID=53246 RepID=UPI0007847ECB|nr:MULTISPECIES: chemotaxis protein CheX [Gammaproteobacteria]MCF7517526.1 chemotaxis protein CheX [Pseudoalteromonas sp. L21]UJX25175.1 chemotaxis protein CheX [Pseudoalteromonas sp. CF6-2]|tara:strand:- start:532 stop:999 length:468 start_codon:yes stop_codon:yes gene_type:complete